MILHYTCPNCGSDMSFNTETGKLSCSSCRHEMNIEAYEEPLQKSRNKERDSGSDRDRHSDGEQTREYTCGNCGAVLMTTADTAATRCSFCRSNAIIAERLTGDLAPAKVIPFAISKEEAMQAFVKWCRKGLLTPRGFMSADRIKSITGIYVPFWLYDLNSKVQVSALCTRVRTYRRGDYIYTETSYYNAFREINLDYEKVPVDASEKMKDELMDRLEPYPYDQLKPFKSPYLAGYIAEKYNYTDEELLPRAKDKISSYIESYIRSTFSGYHTVSYQSKQIDTRNVNSRYVLLPVWIVSYDFNQSEYMFAMNGQTGKVVGKPPISSGKVAAWFSGITAGTFVVMKAIAFALGGGFW